MLELCNFSRKLSTLLVIKIFVGIDVFSLACTFLAFKVYYLLDRAHQQIGGAHLSLILDCRHLDLQSLDLLFQLKQTLLQQVFYPLDGGRCCLSLVGFSWHDAWVPPQAPSQLLRQQRQPNPVQAHITSDRLNAFLVLLIAQPNMRPNRIIRQRSNSHQYKSFFDFLARLRKRWQPHSG